MENEVSKQDQNYTVVARRYRPKTFGELIGQDHISQALGKAIATGRVGHAYLFTGARGVGKTSTARIFAKALNVGLGGEAETVNDISQAIDAGEDMDVIEIDGASNRGIEEIRQLRANVNVRPSRSRYKIYIIDEVHMLTNQAFNALLKTLEEPPSHVKFIFCTTDPDKLPITVLSRCQRYDFAPVKFEAIQLRLQEISRAEGFEADDEALALLARRAAGSMRDSQSLLEQVMSFSTDRITVDQVHALLGTADESQLLAIVESLRDADSLGVIGLVDSASRAGADPGQLAEQLLNYLRDIMAVGVGGGPELLKLANPMGHERLKQIAQSWGLQAILSAIQILDESLVRMRGSVSATTLLEVALLQICQLEQLASIPALLEAVMGGSAGVAAKSPARSVANEKKKPELNAPADASPVVSDKASGVAPAEAPGMVSGVAPAEAPYVARQGARGEPAADADVTAAVAPPTVAPPPAQSAPPIPREPMRRAGASPEALADWRRALRSLDGMLGDFAGLAVAVEPQGADCWNILFPPGASKPCEYCEVGQRKAELLAAVQATVGRPIQLAFVVMPGEVVKQTMATPQAAIRARKLREMAEHPFIKNICEALDGEIVRVDGPR